MSRSCAWRFSFLLVLHLCAPDAVGFVGCAPIDGLDRILQPGRVILLGEIHGTEESPAFVRALACHTRAAGLKAIVGVELLPDEAGAVQPDQWNRTDQDGRTSQAMAALIDHLQMRAVPIVPFDTQPRGPAQTRERAMAERLAASVAAQPRAVHIVLTGNLHSPIHKGSRDGEAFEPLGYILTQRFGEDRVRALDLDHEGGSAWICAPECGSRSLRGRRPTTAALPGDGSIAEVETESRWRVELNRADDPGDHHGRYAVGSITASPPAVR